VSGYAGINQEPHSLCTDGTYSCNQQHSTASTAEHTPTQTAAQGLVQWPQLQHWTFQGCLLVDTLTQLTTNCREEASHPTTSHVTAVRTLFLIHSPSPLALSAALLLVFLTFCSCHKDLQQYRCTHHTPPHILVPALQKYSRNDAHINHTPQWWTYAGGYTNVGVGHL